MNLKKKIDQVVFVKNIFYIFKDNNDNKILNFVIFKIRVIDQNNNIFRFSLNRLWQQNILNHKLFNPSSN